MNDGPYGTQSRVEVGDLKLSLYAGKDKIFVVNNCSDMLPDHEALWSRFFEAGSVTQTPLTALTPERHYVESCQILSPGRLRHASIGAERKRNGQCTGRLSGIITLDEPNCPAPA
jgi:hypothetical protein